MNVQSNIRSAIVGVFVCCGLLISSLVMIGCSESREQQVSKISGPTMGTQYHISWVSNQFGNADLTLEKKTIQQQVDDLLIAFNKSMSTYDPQSELSLINHNFNPDWQIISKDLYNVLVMAERVTQQSHQAFDVTVGPLVNLWGFGPDKSLYKVPEQARIDTLKAEVGADSISLRQQDNEFQLRLDAPRYIDLSAIAKGYAVDVLGEYLLTQGLDNYLVEIGGEIVAHGIKPGQQPWRIAIEAPNDDGRSAQIIIPLSNMGIATSGDYRNFFEQDGHRFSHTIDGRTGYPVEHSLASVSVLHESVALADAWATALTVVGAKQGLILAEQYGLAAYFIVRSESGFQQYSSRQFEQLRLD